MRSGNVTRVRVPKRIRQVSKRMHDAGDDRLLVPDVFPEEDALEWS